MSIRSVSFPKRPAREFWAGAAVALLVATAVFALRFAAREPAPARPAAESPAASSAAADADLAAIAGLGYVRAPAPRAEAVPAVAPRTSARAFLASYYGERWQEVEPQMEAAHADLDVPYVFHAWEDVAPEFERSLLLTPEEVRGMAERKLDWPDDLDLEWVRQNFRTGLAYRLRDDDLPRLQELVAPTNDEIRAKATQWAELIQFTVAERWRTGQVLRAPYTTAGLSTQQGFWSKSTGGYGWAVTLTLMREDYPDAVALEHEIHALVEHRRALVLRYLQGTLHR